MGNENHSSVLKFKERVRMMKFKDLLEESIKPNVWYHATSMKNAKHIMSNGFSLDTEISEGSYRLYGKGIWFANPPHTFNKSTVLIEMEMSGLKIANLRTEKSYIAMDKKLLTIPEIEKDAREYGKLSSLSDKDIESYVKRGTAHFNLDLWALGIPLLGYVGFILGKDDPPFYQGLWLCIYNVDKLNTMPRKIVR